MKILLDTADIDFIKKANDTYVIDALQLTPVF